MLIGRRFEHAMARARRRTGRPSWFGSGSGSSSDVAWAAAEVLGAQAAAVSTHGDGDADRDVGRIWGASHPVAAHAEHLQFTTGEGPGYSAQQEQHTVIASAAIINRQWPGFADAFTGQTPFRSITAVPLTTVGVLDLYYTAPMTCVTINVDVASVVADQVQTQMSRDLHIGPAAFPLRGQERTSRSSVPVAVGIVQAAYGLAAADALAVLRAHAFATGQTVEHLAAGLVGGITPITTQDL